MDNATQTKKTATPTLPESLTANPWELLRLPAVLRVVPIPKSSWWRGIKEGRFPKPIKLGPRTSAWLASDIKALIDRLAAERRA
jgi:predicted DNA-binding transcriptional regulator AlpA